MAMSRWRKKVVWYARASLIKRMGPYPTQLAAWQALRGKDGDPVREAVVWPEEQIVELPAKKS